MHGLAIGQGIDLLFCRIEPVKTAGGRHEFRQFLDRDIVGKELGLLLLATDNEERRKGFHFCLLLRGHCCK